MTVADYIIRRLAFRGVERVYGVYGSANAHLFDAFHRAKGIEIICTGHEQTAGFAAEGDVKTGRSPVGVAIATSGPGAMNLITAIGNCYYDSVPALFITGQINSKFMKHPGQRQRGFQETDIIPMVQPITKWAHRMDRGFRLDSIDHAIELARSGRPGPVLLDIPIDIQKSELKIDRAHPEDPVSSGLRSRAGDEHATTFIRAYFDALAEAKRPVIVVGGGAQSVAATVRGFAERLGVPVFPTWNAVDIATDDWDLFGGRIGTYGGKGFNKAFQQADLALILGCRISGRITGGNPRSFLPNAKKFQVDVDSSVVADPDGGDRHVLHENLRVFFERLRGWSLELNRTREFHDWRATVRAARDRKDPVDLHRDVVVKDGVNPYLFMRELSRQAQANAVVVGDCGGNVVQLYHAFETKWGQRVISNNGNSPMGFALAGAIGAAFANPTRPVICTIGDGGMLLNIQELQTLVNYRERLSNLKVFIINNECYGITRGWQKTNLDGRYIACGPERSSGYSAPDFEKVAHAFGLPTVSIFNPDTMNERIGLALTFKGPIIVDVSCPGWQTYLPRVSGWDTPIDKMETE